MKKHLKYLVVVDKQLSIILIIIKIEKLYKSIWFQIVKIKICEKNQYCNMNTMK